MFIADSECFYVLYSTHLQYVVAIANTAGPGPRALNPFYIPPFYPFT